MRRNGRPMRVPERVLSQSTQPERGYKQVVLYRTRREKKTLTVHTLALQSFVGPRPHGFEGRHWDGDPANNSLGNLLWGTPKENRADMTRHGHDHNARKTHCPRNHPYDEANTYRPPGRNARLCRTCRRTPSSKAVAE